MSHQKVLEYLSDTCNYRSNRFRTVSFFLALAAASAAASYSQYSSSPSILTSGGLINLGNTCYLNAQIECVFHIPYVRGLILDEKENESRPGKNSATALHSLRQLFRSMTLSSLRGEGNPDRTPATSTASLCKSLGINVMEQQDSQEFWKLLLPELKLPSLMNLYEGAYETYIVALDGSGRERKRQESFLDLSLDVHQNQSVQESLEDMFCRAEVLSVKEGNGWKPDSKSIKVDALKGNSLYVAGLPKILQLHLLRFQFDWRTEVISKINNRYEFPLDLDVSRFCKDFQSKEAPEAKYTLQSIVVHAGEYGRGHYYSYVRPDVTEDVWYRYDDDKVTRVTYKEVIEDSFGGESQCSSTQTGWGRWILQRNSFRRYGWGGKSSSAYVLQYVKRGEVATLWKFQ